MKKLPIDTEGESQVLGEAFGAPIQRPAPALGPVLNAFACVRGGEPKIGKDGSQRKWRQRHVDGGKCRLYDAMPSGGGGCPRPQNGLTTARITIPIMRMVGISLRTR